MTIAFEAAPTRLDPRFSMDAYSSRVASLVFASLVRPGPDGGHLPYLAERWESPDARTWTFYLSDRFRFHDGNPVTTRDVAATYHALLDPDMGSPRQVVLSRIERIEQPGDRRIVFRLRQADASFLEAASIAILPQRLAAAPKLSIDELIGAGPYRIVRTERDGGVYLEAFEGFGLGKPTLPAIAIRVVPDGLMRALELRHGSVHFVQNALDPDTVEWVEANAPTLRVLRGPSSNVQYLGMNLEHAALAKLDVRRALAHAIDRERIVRHILEEQATPAYTLLPPEHWAHSKRVRRYRYSPARARRLLDRAGVVDPDGPGPQPRLVLSYKTTTNELARRVAEAIADQLEAVGIRLDIRSYEWGTFFADIRKGSFHLYSLQWVGVSDPDIFRQIFHSAMMPPAGNNRGRFRNHRMDQLTERGLETADRSRRKRIYARVQRLAARRLPYITLWWPQRIVVATHRLAGFRPHPAGDLFGLYRSRLAPH